MPFKKHDIFLSYSSKDKNRIRPLIKSFEKLGWSVWWDNKIPAGVAFDRFIEENLFDSTMVMVIWSKNSIHSDWVRTEAAEGRSENILLPIMIDEVQIPLAFKRIQTANLSNWKEGKIDENYSKFVSNVWDFFWNLVEKKGTKEAFEAYVSKFPNGPHFHNAINLIEKNAGKIILNPVDKKTDKANEEYEIFEELLIRDHISGYEDFLKEFPNSRYREKALDRIKELKVEAKRFSVTEPTKPKPSVVKPSTIHKILQRFKGKRGFLLYPNINEDQKQQIRKRLKNIPIEEKIMAYYVSTVFGLLDNGMAFTTKKIIWRNGTWLSPSGTSKFGEILYEDFPKINFEAGPNYSVLMGEGSGFDSSGWCEISNYELVNILNAIKKLFNSKTA